MAPQTAQGTKETCFCQTFLESRYFFSTAMSKLATFWLPTSRMIGSRVRRPATRTSLIVGMRTPLGAAAGTGAVTAGATATVVCCAGGVAGAGWGTCSGALTGGVLVCGAGAVFSLVVLAALVAMVVSPL